MPQATLSARRLLGQLSRVLSRDELEGLLFASKAELARWEDDALTVEATPDRLDLLCESGLGLQLAGNLGDERGLPMVDELARDERSPVIMVDPSAEPIRPAIGGVVLTAPVGGSLDDGLLAEAIRFQEVLHATAGVGRRVASLGIYPWERLTSPIRYALEPLSSIRFIPLDGTAEVTAERFFAEHPLALRYGVFARTPSHCLTLRDGKGTLLSLPPVLNTREGGETRPGDRVLLLESTGLQWSRITDMLGLLSMVFIAHGWRPTPVPTENPIGSIDGRAAIDRRSIPLTSETLTAISGLSWNAAETEHRLAEVRFGGHPAAHGWRVEVPPWRPDLMTSVDVVEDLVLARGVRAEDGIVPAARTRGRRRPETWYRRRVAELLLGGGYSQLRNPVLVAESLVGRLDHTHALRITNPPSELFAVMRDSLKISLLGVLERNLRLGYPQRFFEIGPVVLRAPGSETGADTRYHAGAFSASERASFADAASLGDYLLAAFGVSGVREPAESPGIIPGRGARLRLAGEIVGELGEIHPRVLAATHVPVPVAWCEIDLTALWPLVRRGRAGT